MCHVEQCIVACFSVEHFIQSVEDNGIVSRNVEIVLVCSMENLSVRMVCICMYVRPLMPHIVSVCQHNVQNRSVFHYIPPNCSRDHSCRLQLLAIQLASFVVMSAQFFLEGGGGGTVF